MNTTSFELEPYINDAVIQLCGHLNENLISIENYFETDIKHRGKYIEISSDCSNKNTQTKRFIKSCYQEILDGNDLDLSEITTILNATSKSKIEDSMQNNNSDLKLKSKLLKARTPNQGIYLENIKSNYITFGVGPAGTGKTYMAIAAAVEAYERGAVRRIVLVRPAVEAGEKLGFLPGDLAQKVDPYLRPMYDALFDFLGVDKVTKLIENQTIEIAPLAYMRGRTINDSFIILDESQNTTVEQMKMFLTRIGFNSKTVITGDVTQIDLPKHTKSGLINAIEVLDNIDDIAISHLKPVDIVRHKIVQKIVNAYDANEKKATNEY